jgi:hypothetical protein
MSTFTDYARLAQNYQDRLYHWAQLLQHSCNLSSFECEDIFEWCKTLASWNGCSNEQTIDCVVTGIVRGVYLPLDNVGLHGKDIKRYYDLFKDYTTHFDSVAWCNAVCLVLRETTSKFSPYTIKTQVIDLGNGYGRVDYVLGNDLLIPTSYVQSAMKVITRNNVFPVTTGKMRDSLKFGTWIDAPIVGNQTEYAILKPTQAIKINGKILTP